MPHLPCSPRIAAGQRAVIMWWLGDFGTPADPRAANMQPRGRGAPRRRAANGLRGRGGKGAHRAGAGANHRRGRGLVRRDGFAAVAGASARLVGGRGDRIRRRTSRFGRGGPRLLPASAPRPLGRRHDKARRRGPGHGSRYRPGSRPGRRPGAVVGTPCCGWVDHRRLGHRLHQHRHERATRLHVLHNWSWDETTASLSCTTSDVLSGERHPPGKKITLRAWDVRLFRSDEAHDQDPAHRRED